MRTGLLVGGIVLLVLGIARVGWTIPNLTAVMQLYDENCISFTPVQCASLTTNTGILQTSLFVGGLFALLGVILVILSAVLKEGPIPGLT